MSPNLYPYEVEVLRTAAELLCGDHGELTKKINTIITNRTRSLRKRLTDGVLAFIGAAGVS